MRARTVGDVVRAASDYLAARDVYEPRQGVECLMARLLKCSRLELYVRFESPLTDNQLAAMRRGVKRLAAGEPVQYVIGETEFMDRTFKVDRRALIPRPETELLTRLVLDHAKLWGPDQPPVIADFGTGSGCIAITLGLERPAGRYVAIDSDSGALELAADNARRHKIENTVVFLDSDLVESLDPDTFSAVVANLPYVPTSEWDTLPVHIRDFEPRKALDGGPDGLSVLRQIIPDTWILLKPDGVLFLEIGHDQARRVTELLDSSGFGSVTVAKDLAGRDRIVTAVKRIDE